MRNTFINEIESQFRDSSNSIFLTGDLGFGVLDSLREKYPTQFYNIGVAEQLMTGMAAGLSLTGKKVFTYSIANFPTIRCLEQIRNDVCYHNLDVKIVSVGAGLSYGSHGYTHFGIEDLALLRPLKNIEIICPADPYESKAAAKYVMCNVGPTYVRLGKNKEPSLYDHEITLKKGEPILHGDIKEFVVMSTGSIGYIAKMVVDHLTHLGIEISFLSCPFVKPISRDFIRERFKNVKRVFTIEEHVLDGGFGSSMLEVFNEIKMNIPVTMFGLPPEIKKIGSQQYLLKECGLDKDNLISKIKNVIHG